MNTLREELIQVAAVAIAAVTDLDYGTTRPDDDGWPVFEAVIAERERQESKWGPQHHSPMEWLTILGEEFGEACRAVLESYVWPERQQRVIDKDKEGV